MSVHLFPLLAQFFPKILRRRAVPGYRNSRVTHYSHPLNSSVRISNTVYMYQSKSKSLLHVSRQSCALTDVPIPVLLKNSWTYDRAVEMVYWNDWYIVIFCATDHGIISTDISTLIFQFPHIIFPSRLSSQAVEMGNAVYLRTLVLLH